MPKITEPDPNRTAVERVLLTPLMVLTFTTGIIDAVSYVGLGRVFTANMTGNLVLSGFALGGAEGLSMQRPIVAIATFAVGAFAAGLLINRIRRSPAELFVLATVVEAMILSVAAAVGFSYTIAPPVHIVFVLIVLTAIAMGIRNAIVRKLAVPDITTTVVTMALAGLAADSPLVQGTATRRGRKIASIVGIISGAIVGTILLRTWGLGAPLAAAAALAALAGLRVALTIPR